MKTELMEALKWARERGLAPDDPRTIRAICTTLGTTREMVESVRCAYKQAINGEAELYDCKDALTALLDLKEEA